MVIAPVESSRCPPQCQTPGAWHLQEGLSDHLQMHTVFQSVNFNEVTVKHRAPSRICVAVLPLFRVIGPWAVMLWAAPTAVEKDRLIIYFLGDETG